MNYPNFLGVRYPRPKSAHACLPGEIDRTVQNSYANLQLPALYKVMKALILTMYLYTLYSCYITWVLYLFIKYVNSSNGKKNQSIAGLLGFFYK